MSVRNVVVVVVVWRRLVGSASRGDGGVAHRGLGRVVVVLSIACIGRASIGLFDVLVGTTSGRDVVHAAHVRSVCLGAGGVGGQALL